MNQYEEWLLKAERDLKGAILMSENAYNDLAAYHCQQCAEKSLKGYLAFQKHEIIKTHNLKTLFWMCFDYDPGFDKIEIEVFNLDGLDVKFRYPDALFEPPDAATLEAIKFAEIVLNYIQSLCNEPDIG